jgi:diguanylate cyclase (GGDEF)-like protein
MVMVNTLPPAAAQSPYAAELQRGCRKLRFTPELEAEYVRAHLIQNQTLIRVTCVLATLLVFMRGVEQALAGAWNNSLPIDFGLVFSGSLVLAMIACSSAFERLFLQWAAVVVPVRNAIVAAQIAQACAQGQLDMLMVLPLLLIGPFFFLGMRFHIASIAGAMTVISFSTCAVYFNLMPMVAIRACVVMVMGFIACAISARNMERWSRKSFLETHLTAELAQYDALTGTKNRRVFDEHLARLWPQAIQDGRAISVLLIDVDHFKAYNDSYGHQAGDRTLRQIAQTMQTFVRRPLDILARYGGEEFVAVLYDTDVTQAKATAERIRQAVEDLALEHRGSPLFAGVTISIGAAVVEPTRDRTSRGALQLADQALYEAKLRGRNRVELMNDVEYRMLVTGIFSRDSARAVK